MGTPMSELAAKVVRLPDRRTIQWRKEQAPRWCWRMVKGRLEGRCLMLDYKGTVAAADCLDEVGRHYHWWRHAVGVQSQSDLDPIGRSECSGIVESIVLAYEKARAQPKAG
jgi:hypothetical protein